MLSLRSDESVGDVTRSRAQSSPVGRGYRDREDTSPRPAVRPRAHTSPGGPVGRASRRVGRMMFHDGPLIRTSTATIERAADMIERAATFIFSPHTPSNLSLVSGTLQSRMASVLYSPFMEVLFAAVIAFNLVTIIIETDNRARRRETSQWTIVASHLCFATFVVEFATRVFIERWRLMSSSWNRLDFVIILAGVFDLAAQSLSTQSSMLSVFRIARLLRLAKVMKMMNSVQELRKLMQMMLTCMRTLFWSFILIFLLMSTWSVIMVELVNPLVSDIIADDGGCGDSTDLSSAYSSVMRSNLTLFQTIIAGDAWGAHAVPIIEAHPWTVVLFVPGLLVVVFGVLNLIIAVVVDTAAEARQNNDKAQAMARAQEERVEKATLLDIFESIDTEKSGSVTLDELQAGVENIAELRNKLRGMDVGKEDLRQLFSVLAGDAYGEVDSEDFIEALSRMRSTDSRTAVMLTKHYVIDIMKRQMNFQTGVTDLKRDMAVCLGALRAQMPHSFDTGQAGPASSSAKSSPESSPPALSPCRASRAGSSNEGQTVSSGVSPRSPGALLGEGHDVLVPQGVSAELSNSRTLTL